MTNTQRGFLISKLLLLAAFVVVTSLMVAKYNGFIPNFPFFGQSKGSLTSFVILCWMMLFAASFYYPFVWIIVFILVAIPPYIGSIVDRSKAQSESSAGQDPFRQEQG